MVKYPFSLQILFYTQTNQSKRLPLVSRQNCLNCHFNGIQFLIFCLLAHHYHHHHQCKLSAPEFTSSQNDKRAQLSASSSGGETPHLLWLSFVTAAAVAAAVYDQHSWQKCACVCANGSETVWPNNAQTSVATKCPLICMHLQCVFVRADETTCLLLLTLI